MNNFVSHPIRAIPNIGFVSTTAASSLAMAEKTTSTTKGKKRRDISTFEFCDVCNRNHDQGNRHKYSSSHSRALSSLLSRFHKKVTDIRFFLRNPSVLPPEHAELNRIWCVVCGLDVHEVGSSFACSNALSHLASVEHLKNLKDFLWKHGGGMDRVDSFRVSETDLMKWEKGCRALKSTSSTMNEGSIGPSKDIQHELTSRNMDSFDNQSMAPFNSNASHVVLPLQSLTNEGYRVCHQEVNGPPIADSVPSTAAFLHEGLQGNEGDRHAFSNVPVTLTSKQHLPNGNDGRTNSLTNRVVQGAQTTHSRKDCFNGLKKFTQISCTSEGSQVNVHSGALPPWLDTNDQNERNLVIEASCMNKPTSSFKTTKSRKLNPKRVGAAWAEKRRAELEMEKQGQLVPNNFDSNWLPNFGRVWQSGTRKESKKEFQMEKQKFLKDDNHSESPSQIQPYISKRMRIDSPPKNDAVNGKLGDFTGIL